MAFLKMGEVVRLSEGRLPRISYPSYEENAKQYLTAQMFTDAIFNQDIYIIQTIINRIDGGLPKDNEVDNYQTLFGDCLAVVLNTETSLQLQVTPDDTLMMALCKSLYSLASADIYSKAKNNKPSTDAKKERDTALRIVLERSGGRKTNIAISESFEEVSIADWVKNALPESD